MKKKNPPYAIFGALAIGVVGILLLIHWKNSQDQARAAELAKMQADFNQRFADLQNQKPVAPPPPEHQRNVYYATQPIDAGAKLSPAFFEKKATPDDVLPAAFTDQSDIVGFYAIRSIEKGDPLTPNNIGKTLPLLSERIPAGMRALALPVFNSDLNDTGGFVVDGDKVDLLFTTLSSDGSQLIRTESAMQNVQVLFVPGPQTRDNETTGLVPAPAPGQPLSVTFQVTPEQAEALIFLSQSKNGHFSMILRGRSDKNEFHPKAFEGADYAGNIKKIQHVADASLLRVDALQKQIEAEQQKEQSLQGTTNETPHPIAPPSQ